VGAWQPGVKGKEGRFQGERNTEQQKNGPTQRARPRQELAEGSKIHRARFAVEQHECRNQHEQADVRRDQVVEAGEANLLVAVVPDHQQPGSDRRNLPGEQENQGIFDRVDQDEGQAHQVEQREV
jgi:hypothetical protein